MRDYTELETLLYRGFLTSEVVVGDVPIVLKSMNHVEYELLDLQSFGTGPGWEEEAGYTLAYSTVFFNHINILPQRHEMVPTLAEAFAKMPRSVLVSLLIVTQGLNRKTAKLMEWVQPYSYGPESRQNWVMRRGQNLCDTKTTGFSGTSDLGVNMHQKLWTYFNSMEDEESAFLADYNLAKFMISPHSKDVQKMDQKDSKKMRTRDQRRKAIYQGTDPSVFTENGQIKVTNETAEELLDQMERSVKGEKDYHDLVIEEHQRRVRQGYQKQREDEERRKEEARQRQREDYRRELEQELEGYTPEEIEHYLKVADNRSFERRQDMVQKPTVSVEEQERNLLRWGFLEEQDLPAERRHYYKEAAQKSSDNENPLIKEHYERVSNDLNTMKPPRRGVEDDTE